MEVTTQVGGPDPSDPQGHPSASSQQLGGGLSEPQGPWRNSGSTCFRQGLALSPEAVTEPEPARQPPGGPAEGSAQWGSRRAPSTGPGPGPGPSPGPRPGVEAQAHLILEKEAQPPPRCAPRDSAEGLAQPGRRHSWLQVPGERAGKGPARVLVGRGRGPCGPQQSQQVPRFLSGETGSAAAQGQGQGQCWCPAQATPTPTQAHSPAPHATLPPAAATRHTCCLDHLLGSIAQALPRAQRGESGHRWAGLLESSKAVTFCQHEVTFGSQRLPAPGHPPTESSACALELEAALRPALPTQPATRAERPLFYTFDLDGPTPQSCRQEAGAAPHGQPLGARSPPRPRALLSTCPATGHEQRQAPPPREATPRPAVGAPTCQFQDPAEGHVLVFDLDTGNTRLGLLCQDLLGSRAVLVGLVPHHPSVYAPDDTPAARPLAVPAASRNSRHAGLWPVSPAPSSPVPSSISSGDYQQVALGPKEAKLSLEPWNGPGPGTPIGVGLLPGPIPVRVPLQLGDRTPSQDPGWPRPAAGKSDSTHTIWGLDAPGMQDASAGQPRRLRVTGPELASEPGPPAPAPAQEAARAVFQAETGSLSRKEASTAHLVDPGAEDSRQGPLGGWPPRGEQRPLSGQHPAAGQPPSPGQPPLLGTPLARQHPLTSQPSFRQEPAVPKEPFLSRGPPSAREAGQGPAPWQEGEAVGLPVHVGVLRAPPAQETCVYVSRDTVGLGVPPGPNAPWLSPRQPFGALRAPGEPLSLVTVTAPGTSYKVLPVAVGGAAPPGPRLKLTAEDLTGSPAVTSLGLLSGAYDAPPRPPPGPRGRAQSPAAVVIDTGSGFTKCGLAGEDHVLSVLPSRVQLLQPPGPGQPRHAMLGAGGGACTVLSRGVVSDWDALEVLWQHLFYCKLGVRPEELAVLVADSPVSPRTNREKVAEILFECFRVPAMQTVQQALLALYAHGRTTGLVLGSGHGTSYVAPILSGDLAPLHTYRLDVAGADLTEYLAELLLAGGRALPKAGLVSHLKETCCYVALDAQAELARAQARAPVDFVLPDQQVVSLGAERFRCPEALFRPHLLGLRQPGLPQLALLSVSRLEARQQEQLLANVVLDGGSTLLRGFPERVRQELGPCATVLGSPHRAVAAWLGGSIMASRDSFQSLWLSRREYEEEGPWAIYKHQL
ncbi:uncharacterized protein LOC118715656 [Pipistrellus kuhlii]|uniref:Actin like 10 n=1 Tax=Pipistrellus kuhlii TaxID=59472 RepID=A0A7J7WDW8_PIPKU|nr:uncharacterized protein LOC118715656 [Pipistrellus kuhlii]KAF6335418.1 hypothetical protein mPipKuh1_008099 [Pipistrellus kuhlii]